MLITVCYVYMWVRFHKCYSMLIRNSLSRLKSRSLRFSCSPCSNSGSPGSSAASTGRDSMARPDSSLLPTEDTVFLQRGEKTVYVTEPQIYDDLSKWTVLLGSTLDCHPQIDSISFIIEATGHIMDCHCPQTSKKKVLKWNDYCLPLACSPSKPFRVVAQASLDNFSLLGVAFIEDRLHLDNGLSPSKIVPVVLLESTINELLQKQCHQSSEKSLWLSGSATEDITPQNLPCYQSAAHLYPQCYKDSLDLGPEANNKLEEQRGTEPLCRCRGQEPIGDSEVCSLNNHHIMEGHGYHLHLSSCHECLELENSTILSVKYSSVENIPDLPVDNSEVDSGDETEHNAGMSFAQSRFDCNSKPPNILVYTGGCQKHFQTVSQLLSECINIENNIIYHLLPHQLFSDPWQENTKLLVLAEQEPLTPQLQTCFLTYLNQGGRVLGLASSLCPKGVCLEERERLHSQLSMLSFTKEDNNKLELNLLATGKVYIMDAQEGGEVELWGELISDILHQRNIVIVRVTHEGDGGEAVLCQVRLDFTPDSQHLTSDDFDKLKVSNPLRYEVLIEILTSLGISSKGNQIPTLSPVHLLAISQEAKISFLKWLQIRADQNGFLSFSKADLRMVSSSELSDAVLSPDRSLPLVINSESQKWLQFCMETYSKNLKTGLMGHILLFAEVVTSTMDLLEGLTLHLPKDMGLIAVASQQIQGRGRGKNAWLSPLGCAMFTVGIQVELRSKLGRRISFVQHLAALAVVEAVLTLPGYQDLDLRLKWPNDIYYSNLIKLGGILVTSTLMGSTFHLLIGCGFNVTNSNPTMCINDLIQQYNIQNNCRLEPLSCALLVARTVNCLDTLVNRFQQGGPDAVLPTYYKRWLHSGTRVRLWSDDGLEVEVVGLDNNGYLQVYSKEQGVLSVEPDGNSFDMLRNLVVIKQH